jgi:hypothetical protein
MAAATQMSRNTTPTQISPTTSPSLDDVFFMLLSFLLLVSCVLR